MPFIIKMDAVQPENNLIDKAVQILKAGGVIAYPTETFYGLAVDCLQEGAIARIFEIKGRTFQNPIALIGADRNDLALITRVIPASAEPLMARYWPGPLTLLFKASEGISPRLTADTGKIGIRISSHPIAQALAAGLGRPITATSANLSGQKECTSPEDVSAQIGPLIDLIIDGGNTPGGLGSTILDCTTQPPAILRQGAIDLPP